MSVILALGANLGDRLASLQEARRHLESVLSDMTAAPVYETAPLYVTDQPHFLNSAVMGRTALTPPALLEIIKDIERMMGREPGLRYGPRVIDIDIIYHDDFIMEEAGLTIPHPLRLERRFVLQPLAGIAPHLIDPVTGQTIAAHLAQLPPDPAIKIHAQDW